MANNMRTFVKFIRPERGFPQGVGVVVPVQTRDISKLEIPPLADFFYFFDASINPKDGHMDQSPVYMVAERLLTRDEAKRLLVPDPADRAHIGWDKKLQENELFALTRNNNIEPVHKGAIVIDANKRQLYPKPAAPKPAQAFKATVGRDIPAPSKAQFKHRRPSI